LKGVEEEGGWLGVGAWWQGGGRRKECSLCSRPPPVSLELAVVLRV
jgi:hypothetical protein